MATPRWRRPPRPGTRRQARKAGQPLRRRKRPPRKSRRLLPPTRTNLSTKRVFENSRWAGVCLAEYRRSRLLVGSVITKSPPRPGAHNAIIADLAMPVVPAPRGGRTWLRGVLVVGDRRRVGDPRTAVACAGQHGRPRRTPREALPPCDSGRHPVHRARWYRVAATAGGVPASRHGVRGLRPLGPQRGVAAHPRRAA